MRWQIAKLDQKSRVARIMRMARPIPENYSGASSDEELVRFWLVGRPEQTIKSYRQDATKFLEAVAPKSIPELTLEDVVNWIEGMPKRASNVRRLISVKSLLTFAERCGYAVFNVGYVIRIPKVKDRRHQRLIELDTVRSMTAEAAPGRDRTLMRLFYSSGCRVSEAVGLNLGDLSPHTRDLPPEPEPAGAPNEERMGKVTLYGKGGKTRHVQCSQRVIDEMWSFARPGDDKETPVFRNFVNGGRLTVRSAQRIVAAARTDVEGVSPHWMRHAHATHALDNGAPIHQLKEQLGHEDISTTTIYVHLRGKVGTARYLKAV